MTTTTTYVVNDYGECHWCGKTGWSGALLCSVCGQTRGQVCPTCNTQLAGPCDGCAGRVTGWEDPRVNTGQ